MATTGRMAVEVHGEERIFAAFDWIINHTLLATGEAVKSVLHKQQRQTRNMLSLGWHARGTKTGSIAPEPPWRISGHLSRSVTVEGPFLFNFKWAGRVGPTAVYARIHELGGVTGRGYRTHLPPRPYFRPAWMLVAPSVPGTFYRAWTRSTRPPRWM